MKKLSTQLFLNGMLILGLTSTTGCGIFKDDKVKSGKAAEDGNETVEENTDGEDSEDNKNTEIIAKEEIGVSAETLDGSNVKVRSFQQFYATYGILLGIPSDNQPFKDAFEDVETNLPTTSSAKSFSGSHQLAAVKLASAGCDIAYDLNSNEEKLTKFGIDYASGTPLVVFSGENRLTIAKTLISKFWNKDISGLSDTDADVVDVASLIEEALGSIATANPETTDAALIKAGTVGACGAVLASLPVSFY